VLTCVLAFCGICIFQLPANIFGTGLAIKLKEQQKSVLHRPAASKLIQTLWRCYAVDSEPSRRSIVWSSVAKKRSQLNESDKQCIRFVLKIQYLRARRHFNAELKPSNDESLDQLELWKTVARIETRLSDLKDRSIELRAEYESAAHKLQSILRDLESV
jgi:macrodomain Ter protein organizer (MatP/YcbG family)